MNRFRVICSLFLSIGAALLASCIDGHEEYWLDAHGGGRAEATYDLPAAVAAMHGGEAGIRSLLEDFLKNTPEIKASSCEVHTMNDRIRVKVRAAFDSALELKNVSSGEAMKALPSAASHLAGNISAGIKGRTLDFKRTVTPAQAIPGAAFLPSSQLDGHRLTYIMHLPAAASESNATRVEDSGRTLVWEFPLKSTIAAPVVTRFKMDIPIPWMLVTSIALPLTVAGGFVIKRLRKPRMTH